MRTSSSAVSTRRLASVLAAAVTVCSVTSAAFGAPPPRFPAGAVWHQNISSAAVHPNSALMISTLNSLGGWGFGRMQIDFGMVINHAPGGSPSRTIIEHPAYGYYLPDCESPGTLMTVPTWAAIEAQTDLNCDNLGNDCHLLVVDGNTLYESYSSNQSGASDLESMCLAVWRLDTIYPPEGRGDHCTSADAAGFPIAPLLFNADEIAASLALDPTGNGDLGHAIRFILPNARMASDPVAFPPPISGGRLYVRPATHAGAPSGPRDTVPYGARLRLRNDFPMTGYNAAARVILHTFQRYGIVLSDGGNVALTAESDLFTTTKWADLGIDSRLFDLTPGATDVAVTDFEVLDTGPRIGETWECVRTVLSCASTLPAVAQLMAVRSGNHVALTWFDDPAADSYNVWYVATKQTIPEARESGSPFPAIAVTGCVPVPGTAATCTDLDAVPRGAPSTFFYQVRPRCSDGSEGP